MIALIQIPVSHTKGQCFWGLAIDVEIFLLSELANLLMDSAVNQQSSTKSQITQGAAADAISLLLSADFMRSPQRNRAQLVTFIAEPSVA